MRVFLQYILPIIAPAAVYLLWLGLRGKGRKIPALEDGPWFWLIVVGFLLAAVSVITYGVTSGHDPSSEYVPPRFEDGKVVPAQNRP